MVGEQAEEYSLLIEPRKEPPHRPRPRVPFHLDMEALVRGHRDQTKTDMGVHAGRTMALRFNEKGRYLRSFVARTCFIDT